MKLSKVFLSPVVASFLTVTASAAVPTFSPRTIELPPLTLTESAKASLQPFKPSESPEPPWHFIPKRHVVIPERRLESSDKFVVSPPAGVDYKLRIKHPDPDVDYKLIVKEVDAPSGK